MTHDPFRLLSDDTRSYGLTKHSSRRDILYEIMLYPKRMNELIDFQPLDWLLNREVLRLEKARLEKLLITKEKDDANQM